MTKRIAIFFLTCVLAAGCCLPALAEEAAPAPVSGPTPETTSSNTDNTVETFPENNTDSNISGKSTPAYYPYQIATVPDGRQTLIVMRYRVPEGTTADVLELDNLTRMGEPYTLWAVTETPEGGTTEEKDGRPSTTVMRMALPVR